MQKNDACKNFLSSVAVALLLLVPSVYGQVGRSPFTRSVPAPEFPKDLEWLNTKKPVQLRDLRGKFVLLDFWTYCCINCMHVLPELKELEQQFDKQLVVIGVHSAKFTTEKDTANIADAILRYEIQHPVVNDSKHQLWNGYGVKSWPTTILIDPEGNVVFARPGEFKAKDYAGLLKRAIPLYRQKGTLRERSTKFELLSKQQKRTPLRYPGKVLADEASDRLFIADSNHNRIIVADLSGKLKAIVGNGKIGSENGSYVECTFHHPQGIALRDSKLIVADTENHLLREIDLEKETVRTVAGTGRKSENPFPGFNPKSPKPSRRGWSGKPLRTPLASPWDVHWHAGDLYIAMAGPHQIWRWDGKNAIGPYAGNGREDIVDGALLPAVPFQEGSSSFAQPSGLASDGKWLFVADSEGSSIRAVPLRGSKFKQVRTVVGTAKMPRGRLFTFGDSIGSFSSTRLQHALGVAHYDGKVYVADTYNNKIKVISIKDKQVLAFAGTGEAGTLDSPAQFDEPSGLSYAAGKLYVADTNNHLIRTISVETGEVATLKIKGLNPPRVSR